MSISRPRFAGGIGCRLNRSNFSGDNLHSGTDAHLCAKDFDNSGYARAFGWLDVQCIAGLYRSPFRHYSSAGARLGNL